MFYAINFYKKRTFVLGSPEWLKLDFDILVPKYQVLPWNQNRLLLLTSKETTSHLQAPLYCWLDDDDHKDEDSQQREPRLMWTPNNAGGLVFPTVSKFYLCQRWGKGKAYGKVCIQVSSNVNAWSHCLAPQCKKKGRGLGKTIMPSIYFFFMPLNV
jgi:hypothetical protein